MELHDERVVPVALDFESEHVQITTEFGVQHGMTGHRMSCRSAIELGFHETRKGS